MSSGKQSLSVGGPIQSQNAIDDPNSQRIEKSANEE